MKLSFVHRFSVLAAALALSLAALEAAAESMSLPAASETNNVSMWSIGQDAQKMLETISGAPHTGDVYAIFIAQDVPHRKDAIDQADANANIESQNDRDSRLRQIAEYIAAGQTKEIEATKPVTGRPRTRR